MTYNGIAEIVANASLRARITAAAAMRGITNPEPWATAKMWLFATQPGWGEAWEAALIPSEPEKGRGGPKGAGDNPRSMVDALLHRRQDDPGAREDVITDEMIATALVAVEEFRAPRNEVH